MRQIMSKASATMSGVGTEDSHCVGLDKDHLNMVRYDSSKGPDYRVVLDLVCRLRKSNGWTGHIEYQKTRHKVSFPSDVSYVIHAAPKV